jgi:thiamine biosynthesis lipoprotein
MWPHESHTIYEVTLKSCKTSCLLLAAVLLVPLIASCSSKSSASLHRSSRLLLGTLVEVTIPGDRDKAASATQAVFDEMKRIEDLTSFHKESGLAAINDAAGTGPVKADAELLGLIATALDTSQKTKGAFDPSVGVLSRLWSFSGGEPRLPEQAEIADALTKVGAQKIQIDRSAGTVSLPDKGMALDLGGIAKGYALDRSAKVLKEHGITSALVNAGGDVLVLGEKEPGKPWRVGVQDPRNPREVAAVVSVKDKVIMTSGDYERFFVKDGKRYHHILDPKTGYPAEGAESVTLVSNSGVRAEPLGATVFVKGVTDGLAYVESLGGIEAMVIDRKGEAHMTPGASEVFQLKK